MDGGQVFLNVSNFLGVVMFVRDGLEDGHHSVDDNLFVLSQLIKNLGHDLI